LEGGSIFLGDIRSLPLLASYHATVEHHRTPNASRRELHARVGQAVVRDNELVLHPRFFTELRAVFPRIVDVDVTPKRGAFSNELTLFRYDVTLRVGAAPAPTTPDAWRDGAAAPVTADELRRWFAAASPGRTLGLRNLANARLRAAEDLRRWLADTDTDGPWSAPPADPAAWDPEALWALADELGGRACISWAEGRQGGAFDVILAAGAGPPLRAPLAPVTGHLDLAGRLDLVNDPLAGEDQRAVVRALRAELREALPLYLIPATIVVLPALPLNINGKVDTRALPLPDGLRDPDVPLVPPSTAVERAIAGVWCGLLGLDQVGVHDNFFEIGGDSLLAVQAMARLPAAVEVELPVRVLLERPTILEVAKHVELALAARRLAAPAAPASSSDRRHRGRL